MLGTLHKDRLNISEVHRFANVPLREKDAVLWDIAQMYQETLVGLREIGAYEEPVDAISCHSWTGDYLLFHADASFIAPTHHHGDPRTAEGRREVLKKLSWESLYAETGLRDSSRSTLYQLAAEKPKTLKRADHLMPVADGFNYLLGGVPGVEISSAAASQLYNPTTRDWSDRLLNLVGVRAKLLPSLLAAGTRLKPLRPELVQATRLEDTQVVASCSNALAASLVGLPVPEGESWAFLRLGREAVLGTEFGAPFINEASCEARFSHTLGHGGAVYGHLETAGLALLEECRRILAETDPGLDDGALAYLAASAPPLESLINPADPRFATSNDLLAKIQGFCRDTGQTVPRKPGPIVRCLMESLALAQRRALDSLVQLTGREFTQVQLLSDSNNSMLHHFIANALQLPVVVAPAETAAIGNVVVQALAMGRIHSLYEARQLVQQSFKWPSVLPHPAAIWAPAYERFLQLAAAPAEAVPA